MCRKSFLQILVVAAIVLACSNAAFAVVLEVRISSGADDYEQYVPSGDMDNGSGDLEITEEGSPASNQLIGLRFNGIDIPQGANITSAYVQFHVDETGVPDDNRPGTKFLRGEAVDNAAPFLDVDNNMSSRPTTSAEASWDWPEWLTEHEEGPDQRTSDISAVIKEIVDRPGWSAGNSLVLIINGSGENTAEAFEGEPDGAPLLHIEFSTKFASGPSPADGALVEDTWASLDWDAGETAVTHDVYMSDNFDDVNDRTAAAFLGNQAFSFATVGFPGFPYPDGMVPGTTYYWAVDEVEADGTTIHRGNVWSFSIPSKAAYDPSPRDGGKGVDPADTALSWTPGFGAKLHSVYFGDDLDTVTNAAGGIPTGTTRFTPGALEKDKVYYWRVDELNPPVTIKGDVWSFRTRPDIVITDPDLIGWWKLDNLSGKTVVDWSGYGNDGTTGGDPQLVEGAIDLGLDLDGSDYISLDAVADDLTSRNYTLSIWIKTTQGGEGNVFASNDSASGHVLLFGVNNGNVYVDDGPSTDWPPAVNDDQWHMITLVQSGTTIKLYTDGVQVASISTSIDVTTETRWSIGQEWDGSAPSDFYVGMVDDARIYNRALTQPEVAELMRGDPLVAWNPRPGNKTALDVEQATQPLAWSAGDNASQHDVYFGMDKDALDLADTSTADIYRGRQAGTSYSPPEGLEWGTGPYYWRIDEIKADGSVSAGSVWSFSVADFLIVDDFESYNDIEEAEPGSNRLYLTWLDGFDNPAVNGAIVGNLNVPIAETRAAYVNSGSQAMPFLYNNSGKYSEATLALAGTARDWTRQGVGQLSLWFRGESTNAAERMYVALNGRAVYHDNPNAAQAGAYEEWVIPLQTFADLGVTLNNVTSIAIGFGTPGSAGAGGTGTVYIDDIRLYRISP